MKRYFFLYVTVFFANFSQAQNNEETKKTDEILQIVKQIRSNIDANSKSEERVSELLRRIAIDSAKISELTKEKQELLTKNQTLKNEISAAEREKGIAKSELDLLIKNEKKVVEQEISLVLKSGSLSDSALLQSLLNRAEKSNATNKNKLSVFEKIIDSLNLIKKTFEKPYDPVSIKIGKSKLANQKKIYEREIPESSFIESQIAKIERLLNDYCEHTNQLYRVFTKAYPLRNDDNKSAGTNDATAFRKELLKGFYYVNEFSYLKKLLNDFKDDKDVQDIYIKKELINCNNP